MNKIRGRGRRRRHSRHVCKSGGTSDRSRGGIVLVGSYVIVIHKFEIWYFVYIVYMVTPLINLLGSLDTPFLTHARYQSLLFAETIHSDISKRERDAHSAKKTVSSLLLCSTPSGTPILVSKEFTCASFGCWTSGEESTMAKREMSLSTKELLKTFKAG